MAEQDATRLFDALDAQGPSETLPAHAARAAAKEEREGLTDALGTAPRLLDVVLAPCTAVDADHHRATFDCGLRGSVTAYYWPTPPAVGDTFPVRFASEHLEPWTRTNTRVQTTAWLYWLAPTGASPVPLYRTAWPLAASPVLEHVADLPFSSPVTTLQLFGFDAAGTGYVQHFTGGGSWVQAIPDWGTGTPGTLHPVPWVDNTGADRTDKSAGHAVPTGSGSPYLTVEGVATGPTGAGVLLGSLPDYERNVGAVTFYSQPHYRYYQSTDGGATWSKVTEHAYIVREWTDPGHTAFSETIHYTPGAYFWGWLVGDGEPGGATGSLILRLPGYVYDAVPDASSLTGFGVFTEAAAIVAVNPTGGAIGSDFSVELAGLSPDGLRELVWWNGADPNGDIYRSSSDSAGPWTLLSINPPDVQGGFPFATDRAAGRLIASDSVFNLTASVDAGDTWETIPAGALLDSLFTAPLSQHGGAFIVDVPVGS